MRHHALVLCLLLSPTAGAEQEAETFKEALTKGDLEVSLQYRFEAVDDDAFTLSANASTLRTALGYRTKPLKGLSAHVEFTNVVDIGTTDRYNNTQNGVTDRPVIADPEMTRFNQISAAFERGNTRVDAGRFEMNLDNQRFIGSVAWRQNYQSLTAARIVNRSISRATLQYACLDQAYTVTGGERPMQSHVFNAGLALSFGTAVGYAYLLDFDNPRDFELSTSTLGLRFAGKRKIEPVDVNYEIEFAHQQDYGSNPNSVRAGYFGIGAGVGVPKIGLDVGYEVLTGNEDQGRFTTPLATLHKFNGWVDKFLNTPEFGLKDLFARLRGKMGPVSWQAIYHDFSAEGQSVTYGSELNFLATYKAPWDQSFGLKAGFYDAKDFSRDTTKIWAWSAYSF